MHNKVDIPHFTSVQILNILTYEVNHNLFLNCKHAFHKYKGLLCQDISGNIGTGSGPNDRANIGCTARDISVRKCIRIDGRFFSRRSQHLLQSVGFLGVRIEVDL